jgi:rubrerythrin
MTAPSIIALPRRHFLQTAGTATLSATAVALLAGCESMARGQAADPAADLKILNTALGYEHDAITAYQIGAESGLLPKPALDVALLFQSHHREHAAALEAVIRKLGGAPARGRGTAEVAQAINASALKTGDDVLRAAAGLEKGAVEAYIGAIPALSDPQLSKVAGRIVADESMHWTALQGALRQPLPAKALSFGA